MELHNIISKPNILKNLIKESELWILFKSNQIQLLVFLYVALSDPGVIWGQKYHLCLFAWKLIFGDWNHQRYIPWWQKIQKSAGKWSKKTFLHFLALWPKKLGQFSPPMCAIWRVFQPRGQLHMWSNIWISVTHGCYGQFSGQRIMQNVKSSGNGVFWALLKIFHTFYGCAGGYAGNI